MATLNEQQEEILTLNGDVFVTACPGSGKTRVLTEKLLLTLQAGIPRFKRVAAVTYTNRAAGEIASRLQESGFSRKHLWTGTIHSFALEWILRPYSSYIPLLSKGFAVADERQTNQELERLKTKHGVEYLNKVRRGYTRNGEFLEQRASERALLTECREDLLSKKLIDFDCILHLAYKVLQERPSIARTLGAIFELICIDEYQDTHDLQFGILSSVVRASENRTRIFIVGDKNQAIYSSLGGLAKTVDEVRLEFGRPELIHRELSGNYRSTQRIVDYCANFCDGDSVSIESLAGFANKPGLITFENQSFHKDQLAAVIGGLVRYHTGRGVKPEEICILGPVWWIVTELGRQLVVHLPNLDLDAPGLSPIPYKEDSLWFKLARLFLTEPSPSRYRARYRWAMDMVATLEAYIGSELPEDQRTPRAILRLVNAISSDEESGLAYLDDVFEQLFTALEIDTTLYQSLVDSRAVFFEVAEDRLITKDSELESVDNLKKVFRHPSGVVVNSCHGCKGEEYEVVICFGALRGMIPHWDRIMDDDVDDGEDAKRLLYVVASRAKTHLHFFSENGRATRRGSALETTYQLAEVRFDYDDLP